MADWKLIKAKRTSSCEVCGQLSPTGSEIYWSRSKGVIRCLDCGSTASIGDFDESGIAGKSAQVQYERKSEKTRQTRENLLGAKFGRVASFLMGEGQYAKAWKKGAIGERYIGKVLAKMCSEYGFMVLHDRQIPDSKANIDHILITDRGVFVIDAKNYEGLVRIDQQGGILSPLVETLYVGNRKQTKLVEGVKKQVGIVSSALLKGNIEAHVQGVLAFYNAEWPIFFKPTEIDGVLINSKGIEASILKLPVIEGIQINKIFDFLKKAFPVK